MHPTSHLSRRRLVRLGVAMVAAATAGPLISGASPASARSGLFPVGSEVIVDVQALNLRTGPGLGHDVITVLQYGASGTTVSEAVWADGHYWYKIDVGQLGWAAGTYLRLFESDVPSGLRLQVVDGPLNLRDAPSLSGRVITTLPTGVTMRVTQADGGTWADGYHWIRVWVEAEHPLEGFVADAFTAPA